MALILGLSPATWLALLEVAGLIAQLQKEKKKRLLSAAEGQVGAYPGHLFITPSKEDISMTASLNLIAQPRTDLQTTTAAAPAPTTQRKDAKVWVNIVGTFSIEDDNGVVEEMDISPFGVPVDVIESFKPYTGNSKKMQQISDAKALMLNGIQNLGASMEPGTTRTLPKLRIEVRRVGVANKPEEASGTISAQAASLFE